MVSRPRGGEGDLGNACHPLGIRGCLEGVPLAESGLLPHFLFPKVGSGDRGKGMSHKREGAIGGNPKGENASKERAHSEGYARGCSCRFRCCPFILPQFVSD